jgi:hypothetical protein
MKILIYLFMFIYWKLHIYLFSFHFVCQFRSTLCALIYNKTLRLNIAAQSNVNTGRILSLISSDCRYGFMLCVCVWECVCVNLINYWNILFFRTIGEMLPTVISVLFFPFQTIIPFIFVIRDYGLGVFIAISVVLVFLPIQCWKHYFIFNLCLGFVSSLLSQKINSYLFYNDERNKTTNETLQGIRIVKYSGLETVFTEKVFFHKQYFIVTVLL